MLWLLDNLSMQQLCKYTNYPKESDVKKEKLKDKWNIYLKAQLAHYSACKQL